MTSPTKNETGDLKRQRLNAVRTAWVLAAIAAVIVVAVVLSGVLGQAPA